VKPRLMVRVGSTGGSGRRWRVLRGRISGRRRVVLLPLWALTWGSPGTDEKIHFSKETGKEIGRAFA